MILEGIERFFGGAFLANAIPHLVAGILRKPFPTPFATPPFKGLSSPAVNLAWGIANLVIATPLLADARAHALRDFIPIVAGFVLMVVLIIRSLKRPRTS